MEVLWDQGQCCIRDILDAFPAAKKPAYTTIQTTVYRLEAKKALRQARKVGNVHVFEATIARNAAQRRLVDEILSMFGGRTQPLMTHLIESGRLTPEDLKQAQKTFQSSAGRRSRNDSAELSSRLDLNRHDRKSFVAIDGVYRRLLARGEDPPGRTAQAFATQYGWRHR